MAHLDHLALYAGADGYPKVQTFDPRHFPDRFGRSPTVEKLGGPGKWAPDPEYGEKVADQVRKMTTRD